MAIKQETETIEGHAYTVRQFGARTGMTVAFRMFKVLGPALGKLAVLKDLKDGKATKLPEGGVEVLLESVFKSVADMAKEEDFLYLVDQFQEVTTLHHRLPDGPGTVVPVALKTVFDDHFAGRYGALLKWFLFAGRVNFSSFFSESPGADQTSAGPSVAPVAAAG